MRERGEREEHQRGAHHENHGVARVGVRGRGDVVADRTPGPPQPRQPAGGQAPRGPEPDGERVTVPGVAGNLAVL